MNWETILCLGDSITFGARSYLGYPEYTGALLEASLGKSWNIVNHAVNGYTAIDLNRSVSQHYAALHAHQPLLTTILIGTNDAKTGTPVEEYQIALEQLIVKAVLLTENRHVLLLHIPTFPGGVAYPFTTEMNATIEQYNTVIDTLATKHKLPSLTLQLEPGHVPDGVHLGREGCQHVAQQLAHYVLKERGL